MFKISALFMLLAITGTVLCGGHGGPGGMMAMMGIGKEDQEVMCKAENLNDDKFDQFRAELKECHMDECAEQADDITGVTKPENFFMAKGCSEKYKTCMKDSFSKGEDGKPDEATKKKWEDKKACVKAAFDKVFGA